MRNEPTHGWGKSCLCSPLHRPKTSSLSPSKGGISAVLQAGPNVWDREHPQDLSTNGVCSRSWTIVLESKPKSCAAAPARGMLSPALSQYSTRGTAPTLSSPGRSPRSTMKSRRSRGSSAELWGSSDRSRSWERPRQPQENAPRSGTSPGALGAGGGMARAVPPPRGSPVPRARPQPCLGTPGRAGHSQPRTLRCPVTPRPLPSRSRSSSRCCLTPEPPPLSVSPSLYCYFPALSPRPGGARALPGPSRPALPPLPQRPAGARVFPGARAALAV